MVITTRHATLATPTRNAAQPQPPEQAPKQPEDGFESSGSGRAGVVLRGAVGAAAGVYAGLATGILPGVAGAAAGGIAGGLIGGFGVGILAEKMGTSGSDTAGAALWGGLVGLVGGGLAGGFVGATGSSPVAAVVFGVAAGGAGLFYGLLNAAGQSQS